MAPELLQLLSDPQFMLLPRSSEASVRFRAASDEAGLKTIRVVADDMRGYGGQQWLAPSLAGNRR